MHPLCRGPTHKLACRSLQKASRALFGVDLGYVCSTISMTTFCPHRHASHLTLRLELSNNLFCTSTVCSPALPTQRAHRTSQLLRVRENGRERRSSCVEQVHKPVARSLRSYGTTAAVQRYWYEENATSQANEEISNFSKPNSPGIESPATASLIKSTPKAQEADTTLQDSEEASDGSKGLHGYRKEKKWSPISDRGRQDIKSLADALKAMLKSAVNEPKEAKPIPRPSDSLPKSPYRHVPVRKTKAVSRGADKRRLADNPWANMLASPVRCCTATGVRMPRDLLVPWSLIRNPRDEKIYHMPVDLVEEDRPKSTEEPESAGIEGGSANLEPPTSGPGSSTTLPSPSQDTESILPRPKTYILPYAPLIDHLTHVLTTIPRSPLDGTPKQRCTKPGAVARLIPHRWKTALIAHKRFAARQSLSGDVAGKPQSPPVEAPFSTLDLEWHLLVDEVMLRLMRKRVTVRFAAMLKSSADVLAVRSAAVQKVHADFGDLSDGQSRINLREEIVLAMPAILITTDRASSIATAQYSRSTPVSPLSLMTPPLVKVIPHSKDGSQASFLPLFDLTQLLGKNILPADHEGVLLVQARMPAAHSFVRELWQLWRFLGGRDGTVQQRDQS